MEDIMCTTKEVAPNHKLIFFHNDTRIFGDWMAPPSKMADYNPNKGAGVTDPMHRFFREVIFVEDPVAVSRLRLAQGPEARVELDFQLAGSWYQRLQLELDGTCIWPGKDGSYVACKTYWKMRKLVVLISDEKQVNVDDRLESRMLVISVSESDASRLELWLKWRVLDSGEHFYRKVFKRVTAKEVLMVDPHSKKIVV